MRKPCQHGVTLPKGLNCDHGYIQVRIQSKGRDFVKNFGPHTAYAQVLAEKLAADKYQEILLGKFGLVPELPERKFKALVPLFLKLWALEKDGDGRLKHNERAVDDAKQVFDVHLTPVFGDVAYSAIRPIDIQNHLEKRQADVKGTTTNKELMYLSSMYTHFSRWIALEKIPPFKIPVKNPCEDIKRAKIQKRTRLLTAYEAKKLKLAFLNRNDADGWEICKMALQSTLSRKDLQALEIGETIDLERAKTGVPVRLPVTVLVKFNWRNWRKRFEAARKDAGLEDLQFRDLRKSGGNWLLGKHDMKLISQFMGHASQKTTEDIYMLRQEQLMKPLADDLKTQIDAI